MKIEKLSVYESSLALSQRAEMVYNAFRSGTFSMLWKHSAGESDDLFTAELYGRRSTWESLTEISSDDLGKKKELEYCPKNKCCRDWRSCFNRYKLETLLKIIWMNLNKFSIHWVGQNKFQRKYVIIYSNQYKDQYDIHEFRKQQDLCYTQVKA